jgi:hypothetical protein
VEEDERAVEVVPARWVGGVGDEEVEEDGGGARGWVGGDGEG